MENINYGVIYFHATWSLDSHIYIKIIRELTKKEDIPLLVVDIDSLGIEDYYKNYNIVSHGKGEMLWIIDGNIIRKIITHESEEKTIKYINQFNKALKGSI